MGVDKLDADRRTVRARELKHGLRGRARAQSRQLVVRVRKSFQCVCGDACTEGCRGQGLLSTSRACAPAAQGHGLPRVTRHQGGGGSKGILVMRGGWAHVLGDLNVKIGWRQDEMTQRSKKFGSMTGRCFHGSNMAPSISERECECTVVARLANVGHIP